MNNIGEIKHLLKKRLMSLFNLEKLYKPPYSDKYVTIFSHPRSGTHFLESFIGENFYSDECLAEGEVIWGHWANRKINIEGNEYQKLFGSHAFPSSEFKNIDYPVIYIYRDGRAVAYSIWKTENFLHPRYANISFSDFLKLKLDWRGSPAWKSREKYTIAEHWEKHVKGWLKISSKNRNILIVSYEELVTDPYKVYLEIHQRFFKSKKRKSEKEIVIIEKAVGLKPNQATKDSWKEVFSREDDLFFQSLIRKKELLTLN